MSRFLVIPFILAAAAAHADPAWDYSSNFVGWGAEVEYLRNGQGTGRSDGFAQCMKVISDARAAGVPDTYEVGAVAFDDILGKHKVALRDAHVVCDLYKQAQVVALAGEAIDHAERALQLAKDKTGAAELGPQWQKQAGECIDAVGRAIDSGAKTVVIGSKSVALADGRSTCGALADASAHYEEDRKAEATAAREKAAAPYKAAGITGDRLAMILEYGRDLQGAGGTILSTPKQLKSAKLMFVLSRSANDGVWMLRRLAFEGDKLVSNTAEESLLRPGARAYR